MQSITDLHQFLGARPRTDGATEFCVWAPLVQTVTVLIEGHASEYPMQRSTDGCHRTVVAHAQAGSRYWYRIDDGPPRPDPASRYQPLGVHGPSEVIDSAFGWTDQHWRCPEREDWIIYELHVGTFTDQGTFASAIDRLPELVDLGITAIELMPVAASAGRWNWGYDGVALYAPADSYGTPDDFRRLVDAAHGMGLAVFLDVVYNHLGPEGNYLHDFGPYLSVKHKTVWGDAPNFDDPEHGDFVRRFFAANAVYWLDEFHLDGLRVDAIHCMIDEREPHVAAEISDAVAKWSKMSGRDAFLIAESNVYDPQMTRPPVQGGIGFDAMWCDDLLHSVFASLRPGEQLCHREYHAATDLAKTVRYGYVYEGTLRSQRGRTELSERVQTSDLIYSIQNHDFIGNHPLGIRLHQLTSHDAHRSAVALLLMLPAIPMIFMGEEFASENPFRFFVDFSDDHLREAVIQGRRREYPQHDWDAGVLPTDPKAFTRAKIGARQSGSETTLRWYRDLIRLRKASRRSGLLSDEHLSVETDTSQNLILLRYDRLDERLSVAIRLMPCNKASEAIRISIDGEVVMNSLGDQRAVDQLLPNHAIIWKG